MALKGEYVDAIKVGAKTEEYRLCNRHWLNRLEKPSGHCDRIVLNRGYPRRDHESCRLVLPWQGYRIRSITLPHFGPDPVTVYAIRVATDTDKK